MALPCPNSLLTVQVTQFAILKRVRGMVDCFWATILASPAVQNGQPVTVLSWQ